MQEVLNVVLATEGQRLNTLTPMGQWMHCSSQAADDHVKEFFDFRGFC